MMKLIYIAHPLAGDGSEAWGNRDRNVERYLHFCAWAMEQGHTVLSWVHHELVWNRGLRRPFTYWLERDVALLTKADEVWLCGPVAVSSGMRVEKQAAEDFGITLCHEPEWDDPAYLPPVQYDAVPTEAAP
jgi:hypothetical protein